MITFVLLTLLCAGIGWYASERLNRRFWVWFIVPGLVTPIVAIIALAVMGESDAQA